MRTSRRSTEEYAPGFTPGERTWRQLFLSVMGWPQQLKTLPRWQLWSVEALLGATFILAAWGFIAALVNIWEDGWW
jgi:hypothetical protein